MAVVLRFGDFERADATAATAAGQAALIELMGAMRKDVTNSGIPLRQEDLMHIMFQQGPSARSRGRSGPRNSVDLPPEAGSGSD